MLMFVFDCVCLLLFSCLFSLCVFDFVWCCLFLIELCLNVIISLLLCSRVACMFVFFIVSCVFISDFVSLLLLCVLCSWLLFVCLCLRCLLVVGVD